MVETERYKLKPVSVLYLDNTVTFGGAINSLGYLIRALDRKHFEPVVISGQPQECLSNVFDCACYSYRPRLHWEKGHLFKCIAGMSIFKFRILRKILTLIHLAYWHLFVSLPEAMKYYKIGRKHNVSIIHLNNLPSSQFPGILAAKLLRVPCVAHLRDFELIHPISRIYLRFIDHYVAISNAIRDNLHQFDVADERIMVVHDALDLDAFQYSPEAFSLRNELGIESGQLIFGLFGRIAEWKGTREFLLAARQVVNAVPAAVGVIVGDAADEDVNYFHSIKALVSELDLEEHVFFTGYRKDVNLLMSCVDIVVHASIKPEPFGMVIIEGMAMKKPVVATRGGGAIDIVVDGETGLLVDIGSPDALARAIISLLRQPSLRSRMGDAGRLRVEKMFNNGRYADQVSSLYSTLLE